MYSFVSIDVDKSSLNRIERLLKGIPNGMGKVISRGINKTALAARTQITRLVSSETNVKQKDIRNSIVLRRATYQKWQADIGVNDKRIDLFKFGGKTGQKTAYEVKTTEKQSKFLYSKVFKPKYGKAAISAKSYVTKRKGYLNASYEIEKGNRKKMPDGSFIATMKSGHTGLFIKRADIKGAITELKGPSAGGVIERPSRIERIKKDSFVNLNRNIDTQVDLLLRGGK